MKIRIGDLIRYKGGFGRIGIGIVIDQPYANYPVWRVFMENGARLTLSGDQIVEVVNENR
jgi:hypothetical protein